MIAELVKGRQFHKTTQAWWYQQHGNPINERLLSKLSVAVTSDAGELLAIAYLYPAETADICWIGFTIRNPFVSAFKAGKALKLLLAVTEDEVKRLGYSVIYAAYDAKALQKLCRSRGYFAGSQVQEYFKELS